MTNVIVTLKILPEVETKSEELIQKIKEIIEKKEGKFAKWEENPIAFGLKEIKVYFLWPEEKGNVDIIAEEVQKLSGVSSSEIEDVRREVEF